MIPLLRYLVIIIPLTLVVACQSYLPPELSVDKYDLATLSIEEAKNVVISIESVKYQPPPRAIDDLRELIGTVPEAPTDCQSIQEDRQFDIERLVDRISGSDVKSVWLQSLLVRAGADFARGDFRSTLALLDQAIIASNNTRSLIGGVSMKGNILIQKAIVFSAIRDVESAQSNLNQARTAFAKTLNSPSNYYTAPELKKDYAKTWVKMLISLGEAAVLQAQDDLVRAEYYYRNAITLGRDSIIRYNYYDHNRLAEDFSQNLMQQGRLSESELIARTALKRALTVFNPQMRYTAQTAGIVTQLAKVLLDEGRLEDAEYMAQMAVKFHEKDCSLQGSLGYVNTRKVLASVLAAQGKWDDVITQFMSITSTFSEENYDLDRLFGDNLDWGLALVYTGETVAGFNRLEKNLANTIERHGENSYEVAEVRGLLAIAKIELGMIDIALDDFKRIFPKLVDGRDQLAATTGETIHGQRATIIFNNYLDLLGDIYVTKSNEASKMISEELFRVSSVTRTNMVQRALAAAATRSGIADPELYDLVRQEQDATREMNSLIGTLSYFETSENHGIGPLRMQELRERVFELREARLILINEIRNQYPGFSQLMSPGQTTVSDIRGILKEGESLLSTHTTQTKTYVWVINKQGPIRFFTAPIGSNKLESMVQNVRKSLTPEINTLVDIPPFNLEAAYQIYAAIVKPADAEMKDARHLVFVPGGSLGKLPPSLLPTELVSIDQTEGISFETYRHVPWLVRNHAVSVFPSLASFYIHRTTSKSKISSRPFVGFGDPNFDGNISSDFRGPKSQNITERDNILTSKPQTMEVVKVRVQPRTRSNNSASLSSLPPLPDTRSEILQIGTTLGANEDFDIFLGQNASEKQVKKINDTGLLAKYKVIAFATHAMIPGDLDGLLQPALALSMPLSDSKEDGLLDMGDIMELDISADWVVLSACNTAAAQNKGADAISGLGRAFFYAGARSLLVSNWPVETTSTKELTTTTFKLQAESPELSRAEALRQAKIKLIDHGGYHSDDGRMIYSYGHPIFWAPFTLVGDGGK